MESLPSSTDPEAEAARTVLALVSAVEQKDEAGFRALWDAERSADEWKQLCGQAILSLWGMVGFMHSHVSGVYEILVDPAGKEARFAAELEELPIIVGEGKPVSWATVKEIVKRRLRPGNFEVSTWCQEGIAALLADEVMLADGRPGESATMPLDEFMWSRRDTP